MKKLILRKCVACQKRQDKSILLRIVKTKNGSVFIDKEGKADGRGAYICKNEDCLQTAIKRRSLERALRTSISEEIKNELLELINE